MWFIIYTSTDCCLYALHPSRKSTWIRPIIMEKMKQLFTILDWFLFRRFIVNFISRNAFLGAYWYECCLHCWVNNNYLLYIRRYVCVSDNDDYFFNWKSYNEAFLFWIKIEFFSRIISALLQSLFSLRERWSYWTDDLNQVSIKILQMIWKNVSHYGWTFDVPEVILRNHSLVVFLFLLDLCYVNYKARTVWREKP
jgi:hypothetical protein